MQTTLNSVAVAVAVLAGSACGYEESNAVDLPAIDGIPVVIENARMAESRALMLGGGGSASFSSGDAPNAIGLAYDVRVVGAAAQYSGVSARLACRVGDHTIISNMGTDASNRLVSAQEGTKLEGRETFLPTPFANEIPRVCETTLYYTIAPPIASVPRQGDEAPADDTTLEPLGTVCFVDGKLAVGPCSAEQLPRVPASTPVAASRLIGRIGAIDGGGYGLGVTVLATAGEGVPERFLVGTDATCKVGDTRKDVPLHLLMFGHRVQPGESIVWSGSTPSRDALQSAPEWCTVEVRVSERGEKTLLAEYCVRDETTTEGRCE